MDGDCGRGVSASVQKFDDETQRRWSVLASDSDGCKTEKGYYYIYAYAKYATSITILVEDGGVGDACDNAKNAALIGGTAWAFAKTCFLSRVFARDSPTAELLDPRGHVGLARHLELG